MKLQIQSDLHLEFAEFEANCSQADVLILAGDIHVGTKGVEWAVSLGLDIPVIYVAGNHEFYHHAYPSLFTALLKVAEGTHVHVLENNTLTLDGVTFHGTTLWTDFQLFGESWSAEAMAEYSMPDYKVIWNDTDDDVLAPRHTKAIHANSLNWLAKSLESSPSETNVVVTHHAPSFRSCAERFKNDKMSAAFMSNLEPFVEQWKPDVWFHGHCHNLSDYQLGDCRVVCNPRGYPRESGTDFIEQMIVEV
ncbi:metallophosphoesterase [Leucothrix pacifica]|nr:metallophosphoesterase [Leucothrix pacifica]